MAGSAVVQANSSFGPPQLACGGEGEKPCTEGGEIIDAVDVGPAETWGCSGKQLYFTPHKGGQCWSCPEGYKRRTTPIHWKTDACTERGWGNDKRDSRFVRSVYGCPGGQFHRNGRCLQCPGNADVRGLLGINPMGRCTTKPGCQQGLETEKAPPKVLTSIGIPFEAHCTAEKDPLKVVLREGRAMFEDNAELLGLAVLFITDVSRDQAVKDAIKAQDGRRLLRALQGLRSYQNFQDAAQAKGYKSLTLGSVFDVQVGAGANQEQGVAFDWQGDLRPYTTTGVSAGIALGVDAGFSLGIWRSTVSGLAGYSQGAAIAIPAGTPGIGPSVGAAAWFSYAPMAPAGMSVTAGAGLGAELGELNATLTQVY
jgi:hypothetical protein